MVFARRISIKSKNASYYRQIKRPPMRGKGIGDVLNKILTKTHMHLRPPLWVTLLNIGKRFRSKKSSRIMWLPNS